MNHSLRKIWLQGLMLGLLVNCGVVLAQNASIPRPADQYLDEDRAAKMPELIEPGMHRMQRELDELLKYDPQNVRARIQSGFAMIARGYTERGLQEFNYAIQVAPAGSQSMRQAHWAYGWGLFRVGRYPQALQQWQVAQQGFDGHPNWVPWTMAIGLWAEGQQELALDYWEAAVRSDPNRWAATRGLEKEMESWRPEERNVAQELHAEWKRRLAARH